MENNSSEDLTLRSRRPDISTVIADLSSQGAVGRAREPGIALSGMTASIQEDPLCVSGQLALFSPFELLQISHQLRKHGNLEMIRDDGLTADCRLGEGGVLDARCGHRRGREAVLTFVWWRKGTFRFTLGSDQIPGLTPIKIPELTMDAVFMADEIEHRSRYLPLPRSPLTLKTDLAPEDRLNCRIGDVFEFIKLHPGVTTAEMEETLPLAPTQVRLSLALMAQDGILEVMPQDGSLKEGSVPPIITKWYNLNAPVNEESVPPSLVWWYNLTKQFPGGLRLLIAAVPEDNTELVWELVKKVAKLLEVPAPNVMCSTSGPSFVRLRVPCGGVLSLTILPLMKKNRYMFESFVRTMQACFLCSDERIVEESQSWKNLIPPNVKNCLFKDGPALYDALSAQMKQMSTGTNHGN